MLAALYLVTLAVLTVPAILLAFGPTDGLLHRGAIAQGGQGAIMQGFGPAAVRKTAGVYLDPWYWLWLVVMAGSQFLLLAVPVRLASLRPVSRGPVWRTVLAAGLMAGGLAAGAMLSIYEYVVADSRPKSEGTLWLIFFLSLLTWCAWSAIFIRMSRSVPPADLITRQCNWLFRGSVLELLIAVPTHIVTRWRDYCCAGMFTFIGLTMGIGVMLFAFGPAVFFLFLARWRRLHPAGKE
jgi:hypothetical protein